PEGTSRTWPGRLSAGPAGGPGSWRGLEPISPRSPTDPDDDLDGDRGRRRHPERGTADGIQQYGPAVAEGGAGEQPVQRSGQGRVACAGPALSVYECGNHAGGDGEGREYTGQVGPQGGRGGGDGQDERAGRDGSAGQVPPRPLRVCRNGPIGVDRQREY